MKVFSEETLKLNQFTHFKRLITKAIDKKIALNQSDNLPLETLEVKYPIVEKLKIEFSKNLNTIDKIDSSAKHLNDYFIKLYIEKGKESINIKRRFEKDLNNIISALYYPSFGNKTESTLNFSPKYKKTGPGYSDYIFVSLKYILLQKFCEKEKLNNKHDGDKAKFYDHISSLYSNDKSFKKTSFKNAYNKIEPLNLDIVLRENNRKKYISKLLTDIDLLKNQKIITYLKKFNN